jgi:hypothetical protein
VRVVDTTNVPSTCRTVVVVVVMNLVATGQDLGNVFTGSGSGSGSGCCVASSAGCWYDSARSGSSPAADVASSFWQSSNRCRVSAVSECSAPYAAA